MLDPKHFTERVKLVLNSAVSVAKEHSHQQFGPLHLALALFEDPTGKP
jgi:ATP-dependent Clp protease ATP-binding subunit ClpA